MLLVGGLAGCGPVSWGNNLEAGLSKAAVERRPAELSDERAREIGRENARLVTKTA